MLWKCEKCQNFEFPELDEDGNAFPWCNHPKVICVFMNFMRKYKCKYYRQILYTKLLKQVENKFLDLDQFFFYYRERQWKPITTWRIKSFKKELEHYLDLRDYLFTLKVTTKEINKIKKELDELEKEIRLKNAEKGTHHDKDIIEFEIKMLNYKLNNLSTTYKNILKMEIA